MEDYNFKVTSVVLALIFILLTETSCSRNNESTVSNSTVELGRGAASTAPPDAFAIIESANQLEREGNLDEAIEHLKLGLRNVQLFNPTIENHELTQTFYIEVDMYKMLSRLYVETGNDEKALETLQNGVYRNSGSGELLSAYLQILGKNGRKLEAEKIKKDRCQKYFISDGFCKK